MQCLQDIQRQLALEKHKSNQPLTTWDIHKHKSFVRLSHFDSNTYPDNGNSPNVDQYYHNSMIPSSPVIKNLPRKITEVDKFNEDISDYGKSSNNTFQFSKQISADKVNVEDNSSNIYHSSKIIWNSAFKTDAVGDSPKLGPSQIESSKSKRNSASKIIPNDNITRDFEKTQLNNIEHNSEQKKSYLNSKNDQILSIETKKKKSLDHSSGEWDTFNKKFHITRDFDSKKSILKPYYKRKDTNFTISCHKINSSAQKMHRNDTIQLLPNFKSILGPVDEEDCKYIQQKKAQHWQISNAQDIEEALKNRPDRKEASKKKVLGILSTKNQKFTQQMKTINTRANDLISSDGFMEKFNDIEKTITGEKKYFSHFNNVSTDCNKRKMKKLEVLCGKRFIGIDLKDQDLIQNKPPSYQKYKGPFEKEKCVNVTENEDIGSVTRLTVDKMDRTGCSWKVDDSSFRDTFMVRPSSIGGSTTGGQTFAGKRLAGLTRNKSSLDFNFKKAKPISEFFQTKPNPVVFF